MAYIVELARLRPPQRTAILLQEAAYVWTQKVRTQSGGVPMRGPTVRFIQGPEEVEQPSGAGNAGAFEEGEWQVIVEPITTLVPVPDDDLYVRILASDSEPMRSARIPPDTGPVALTRQQWYTCPIQATMPQTTYTVSFFGDNQVELHREQYVSTFNSPVASLVQRIPAGTLYVVYTTDAAAGTPTAVLRVW